MTPIAHAVRWRLQEAAPGIPIDYLVNDVRLLPEMQADVAQLADPARLSSSSSFLGLKPQPDMTPSKPKPSIVPTNQELPYAHLGQERVAFIGAGAGAIIMASYFVRRGVAPENITIIDPQGDFGGMWRQPWAQSGGFNNPVGLKFDDMHQLEVDDRSGEHMLAYLQNLAKDYLRYVSMIPSEVVDLQRRGNGKREWLLRTEAEIIEANTVGLATGTPIPRRINGEYIKTNLDVIPSNVLKIERFPRTLTSDELSSGRPIVLIGLGNSTAAMLQQIQRYEDITGRSVSYTVLSHLPGEALKNPSQPVGGRQSVFRKPSEGYLTGYSGDLPRDAKAYHRALYEDKIVGDVSSIAYDQHYRTLTVLTKNHRLGLLAEPHIFALIGYRRKTALLEKIGAMASGGLLPDHSAKQPAIRPSDGAVATIADGYNSEVFAVGAVAATKDNPNAAVIPGIQAQAPGTMLTIALRRFYSALVSN